MSSIETVAREEPTPSGAIPDAPLMTAPLESAPLVARAETAVVPPVESAPTPLVASAPLESAPTPLVASTPVESAPVAPVETELAPTEDVGGSRARELSERWVARGRGAMVAALDGARGGIREAERRLEEEEREWDARAEAAALPHVDDADPMTALASRIDRESDYWRTFAVRNMRPGAARNLAILGGALTLVSGLALGLLGLLRTLFGGAGPDGSVFVTAAGVALCAVVACALGIASERGRVSAAREALARADHAERRLERVAAILALRTASPAKYVDALARLERDR